MDKAEFDAIKEKILIRRNEYHQAWCDAVLDEGESHDQRVFLYGKMKGLDSALDIIWPTRQ